MVGRQVHLAQRALREIHGVVVPAAFGAAVRRKVFHRSEHRVGGARVGALKAPDSRRGHSRSQVRILSRAFGDAAPAGIAGEDRKSTRLNSSHRTISYAVFCLKKKKKKT